MADLFVIPMRPRLRSSHEQSVHTDYYRASERASARCQMSSARCQMSDVRCQVSVSQSPGQMECTVLICLFQPTVDNRLIMQPCSTRMMVRVRGAWCMVRGAWCVVMWCRAVPCLVLVRNKYVRILARYPPPMHTVVRTYVHTHSFKRIRIANANTNTNTNIPYPGALNLPDRVTIQTLTVLGNIPRVGQHGSQVPVHLALCRVVCWTCGPWPVGMGPSPTVLPLGLRIYTQLGPAR